jgi:DnaJ family protein C protein 13
MTPTAAATASSPGSGSVSDSRTSPSFLVTKHSWKGKYKRVLALGERTVATLNPSTMDATNQWPWTDVVSVIPVQSVIAGGGQEWSMCFRKGKKTDTFKFSTEHRAEVITQALKHHEEFADKTFGAGNVS